MIDIPLKNPKPDFDEFIGVVNGTSFPDKVHNIEVIIDEEIKKYIIENYFDEENASPAPAYGIYKEKRTDIFTSEEYRELHDMYYQQIMKFYHVMGYSVIPDHDYVMDFYSLNNVGVVIEDTALISRGKREWAQEGRGVIQTWEDFEKFPWKSVEDMLKGYEAHLDFINKNIPEGMKIAAVGAVFAPLLGWMLGFEGLFYKLHDDPALVEVLFEKTGEIFYKMYSIALQFECVGVLWHGDDLGFKTSTLVSPGLLKKLLFPWMQRYSSLAHEKGRSFFIHCCGFKDDIIESFISEIKCDALHSFENACCPVTEYKKKYGSRVALLGGVDINVLAGSSENDVRRHVREILETCMKGGRYALGSGNSITNFIPVENYLAMLDEGQKWA
jgi:uroporphyrinogen decarboxylase